MVRIILLLVLTISPLTALAETSLAKSDLNNQQLQQLIRQVETQYNGESAHALTTMSVSTENWQRTLSMEFWSWQRERFLTRILRPAKEKGVGTLKIDREVWNYLPKVDRVIKIPSSMMGGAWMGSHITNDDLVKSSHVDKDYQFTLLSADELSYQIECLPWPDTPTVWGKLIYTIDRPTLTPKQIRYFDEEMILVRTIYFDQLQKTGERIIPMRMRVQPADKPGEQTVLHYQSMNSTPELGRHSSRYAT